MKTKFALRELVVDLNDGPKSFWFDGNSKITGDLGSFENPVANAFSLVQVQDCPFATPTCMSVCFVHGLEKAEQNVHDKYKLNSGVVREILNTPNQAVVENAFADYIKSVCAPFGFRWHVSGDIISLPHAKFIASVSKKAAPTLCWIYTRSFYYLEPLLGIKNLVVNLSADKDNWDEAMANHKEYGLRICYLTLDGSFPELPEGSVIFPSYELRGRDLPNPTNAPWWQSLDLKNKKMVCPPDFFGQSEKFRCGPCKKCLI